MCLISDLCGTKVPFFHLGGDEIQKVVVLNYSPEQTSVNAVNFKNRKKVTFKEHTMEPIVFFHNCINGDRLPLLLDVMQKMFQSNKGGISKFDMNLVIQLQ